MSDNISNKANEIDQLFKKYNITSAKKSELRAKFKIAHDDASAIWSALEFLGYTIEWFVIIAPQSAPQEKVQNDAVISGVTAHD
jgi:hypothetical protein